MRYMIIAGEASGDLHASQLITALRTLDSSAEFAILGGDKMAQAAGTSPVVHMRDMAFMGFSEVLRHLGKIRRNFGAARGAADTFRPDKIILVDYPGFNLKMAKYARKRGIPVTYYISPKVWAWKEGRLKKIRRYVDKMLVIFPFEVEYYRQKCPELNVEYVGNPTLDEVNAMLGALPVDGRGDFLKKHGLRDRPLIALLPGSRYGEIRNNLGVMLGVTDRLPQYRAVIAGAPGIDADTYSRMAPGVPVVYDSTIELLRYSKAALVTSGTATLETALTGTSQVACYRSNGSKLAYNIMKRVIKTHFVTLPNLVMDREIIPEMLLHQCTVDLVSDRLFPLLRDDTEQHRAMLDGYAELRRRLANTDGLTAAERAAKAIVR